MSLRVSPWQELATSGTKGVLASCQWPLCVHASVYVFLWTTCLYQQLEWGCGPLGFVRPGATNWGDWDPGGRYCLKPAAGGIHIVHIFRCIHMYISHWWTFFLISQPGQQDEATESVFVSVPSLSVCAELCAQLPMYVLYMCGFVCVPTGNPRTALGYRAETASPLSGHWISFTQRQLTIYICFTLEMGLEVRNFIFFLGSSWIITAPAEGFASPASGVKCLQHSLIITSTQCLHCNLCLKNSLKISAN